MDAAHDGVLLPALTSAKGFGGLPYFLMFLAFYGLAAGGLVLWLVDYRDRAYGFARFIFTRPLSTKQLVRARLQATMVYAAACYVPVVLLTQGYLLLAFLGWKHGFAAACGVYAAYILLCLYLFPTFVVVAWTLLRLGFLVPVAFLAGVPLAMIASAFGVRDEIAMAWLVALAVFLVVAGVFRAAWKRGLLDRHDVRRIASFWPICVIALAMDLPFLQKALGSRVYLEEAPIAGAVCFLAVTLVPLLPFATVPLSIHRARHT